MSDFFEDSPRRPPAKDIYNEKLFWSGMDYHSVSQSLNEVILEKSHGELCPLRSSCASVALNASTAMNSMIDQHCLLDGSYIKTNNNNINNQTQQIASPAKPQSPLDKLIQSNLDETESSITKSVQAEKLEQNLSLYHKEAFQFLISMNSNRKVLREAEAYRRIRRELNLDNNNIISSSKFSRTAATTSNRMQNSQLYSSLTFPLEPPKKLDLSILKKQPTFVNEKKYTVQTIMASTFCKTFTLPNKLRTLRPSRKQSKVDMECLRIHTEE